MALLQSKESEAFTEKAPANTYTATGVLVRPTEFAGRTMDLTIFAATRALDVLVGTVWSRRKSGRVGNGKWTRVNIYPTLL
jgi:hypothetical protein